MGVFSGWCLAERCIGTRHIDNVTPKSELGSVFTHAEKPSRMDETSFS